MVTASGLLLAATNHPELIDPALWRRFDLVIEFGAPEAGAVSSAIQRFLGPDLNQFKDWLEVLSYSCQNESFSDIERLIRRLRRNLVIGGGTAESLVSNLVKAKCASLDRQAQIEFAVRSIVIQACLNDELMKLRASVGTQFENIDRVLG